MIDSVLDVISKFLSWVIHLLPTSPFTAFIDSLGDIPYLGWFNWFVPVGSMIAVGEAWLVAIGLFYLYSVVLRWVKAID